MAAAMGGGYQNPGPGGAGGGGVPQMVGNIRVQQIDDTNLGVEIKLGGFSYQADMFDDATQFLTMVSTLTDTSTTASFTLRLYDLGAPGTPQAGDLRASASLATGGAAPVRTRTALTIVAVLTPTAGEILEAERIYEVRGILTGGVGDLIELDWAGIEGNG